MIQRLSSDMPEDRSVRRVPGARAGHEVTVYNRAAEKARAWVAEHGGKACATPAEAAVEQDFVMICVGNDQDLLEVVDGPEGILAGARSGTVIVDHTTASAGMARQVAQLA